MVLNILQTLRFRLLSYLSTDWSTGVSRRQLPSPTPLPRTPSSWVQIHFPPLCLEYPLSPAHSTWIAPSPGAELTLTGQKLCTAPMLGCFQLLLNTCFKAHLFRVSTLFLKVGWELLRGQELCLIHLCLPWQTVGVQSMCTE